MVGVLSVMNAAEDWTASGSFHYTNRLYDLGGYTTTEVLPIRGADVEVIDTDTLEILAIGSTGPSGAYAIHVTDNKTRPVAVRVLSRSENNPDLHLRVIDYKNGNAVYAVQSPTVAGHGRNQDVDFGAITPPASIGTPSSVDPSSMVFNTFDMGLRLYDWIEALEGVRPSKTLTITWSPVGGRSGSFFSGTTLYLADDDGYDDPNILHEMGHFIESEYGQMMTPGGAHYIGDSSQDLRLSWSEGFATFVSNSVLQFHNLPVPHVYMDRNGFAAGPGSGFDYSLEPGNSGGGANERAVNAALWDIIDSPSSDDDELALAASNVWSVLRNLRNSPPESMTIESFWDRWFALGLGERPKMESAFAQQMIEFFPDAYEPNGSFETATPLEPNGPVLTATFYSGPDEPEVDDDFYRFTAIEGGFYVIEATNLMFGRPDPELLLIDSQSRGLLAMNDDILDPTPNRKNSTSANLQSDQRSQILWRATESREFFVLARKSAERKAAFNRYGTYQIRVRAINPPAPSVESVSPSRVSPGERYRAVIKGANIAADASATFSGSGVVIENIEWLDMDQIAVTIFVESGAAPGPRSLTIENAPGLTGQLAGAITIDASAPPQVLISEADLSGGKFELVNLGQKSADLNGWRLVAHRDGVSDQLLTFPNHVTIAGGATLLVSDASGTNTPTELYTANSPNFRLLNEFSGSMELFDAAGASADFVQFIEGPVYNAATIGDGTAWHQPEAQSPPAGYTLARKTWGRRTATGTDWTWQAPTLPLGSEGRENFSDRYEDNDTPQSAKWIPLGAALNLQISPRPSAKPADVDWFAVPVAAQERLIVDISMGGSGGDLDAQIFAPGSTRAPVVTANSTTATESAQFQADAPGIYRIRIFGKNAGDTNDYTLTVSVEGSGTPTPTATPPPTPTPTPTPTPSPTPTPTPSPTLTPTPTPTPTFTPTPTPLATPLPELATGGAIHAEYAVDYADIQVGPEKTWISIWGNNLGIPNVSTTLTLGDATVTEIASWTPGRVDFAVPRGAASGDIVLHQWFRGTNPIPFTVRESGTRYFVDGEAAAASDANDGLTVDTPWKTIGHAIATLSPGDSLYIRGGVYFERIAATATASADAPIFVKAYPNENVTLINPGGTAAGIALDGASHWRITGLALRGFEVGVSLNAANDIAMFDIDPSACGTGLAATSSSNLTIAQSRFNGNALQGIKLTNCAEVGILDSEIAGNGTGVFANSNSSDVAVTRSEVYGNFGMGLDIESASSSVDSCMVYGNALDGVRVTGSSYIGNCVVWSNGRRGIYLGRNPGVTPYQTVLNCTVARSLGGAGIEADNGIELMLKNSIVVGESHSAIVLRQSPSAPSVDHLVVHSGISAESGPIVWGISPVSFDAEDINSDLFAQATGQPSTVIAVSDPGEVFENYEAGDLQLSESSPALNFSSPVGAPQFDILRRDRRQAGLADAGAYERFAFNAVRGSSWAAYE